MVAIHNPTSGITKITTGIDGLDEITRGGLPRNRTSLVVGGPGSGKTVFGLQTLVNGAYQSGEPGIFVAFEEQSQQILANAASFGWDLQTLERDKLFFLDARITSDIITIGQFDLSGMLASLRGKAEEMSAAASGAPVRIVFDSLDVLLLLMNDPVAERRELYRVRDWLAEGNLTGILTARLDGNVLNSARHYGFLHYMSDFVVELVQRLEERVSLRTLRVIKYRGSGFSENEVPMVIANRGIEVANIEITRKDFQVFKDRLSTGIPRLDTMLNGGYFHGSSVLITGYPGTAKSTLAGSFIQAACQRGERALYISFDESAGELSRNMASVNIHLDPYIKSGILQVYSCQAEGRSAEEHMVNIQNLIQMQQPACLVIDPLSAMTKAGGLLAALTMAQRLIHVAKSKGITMIFTSLLEGNNPEIEASPLRVSTIADTWIHLTYVVQGGERNRALTIIKSRGTDHSNQVRELILSNEGVTLSDVYTAGGDVLMGSLRYEKEIAEKDEKDRFHAEVELKRRELMLAKAELDARLAAVHRDVEIKQTELEQLEKEQSRREKKWTNGHTRLFRMRGGDAPTQDSDQ